MKDIHASLIAMAASFVLVYIILYYTKPSWVMHTKNGKTELRQDKLILWSALASVFTALVVAIFYPDRKRMEGGLKSFAMKSCGYGMKSCGMPYRFSKRYAADNAMLL